MLPAEAERALAALERFGVHLGLERIRALLAALGDPQRGLPTVLVGGTNGKGSTASLLAGIAGAAGHRTGLYTSPHLESVEERVRVDGVPLPGDELGALALEVVAAGDRLPEPPTWFEATTALALVALRRRDVELAVLEVGLGGRLDATNAAEPLLSVITPLSLEHREHLGSTLSAIAREKAGILRPGRPAVVWADPPEAAAALEAAARAAGARLHRADREVEIESIAPLAGTAPPGLPAAGASRSPRPGEPPAGPWSGQHLVLATPEGRYALDVPLLGRHQAVNAALAIRAAELLAVDGWRLDAAAIAQAAARWHWPGRLEVVALPPGAPARRVLLDAAHNPGSAQALAAFLAAPPEPFPAPPVLLFGVLADKEAGAMLPPLAALAGPVILTRPPTDRGRDPHELLPLLPGRGARVEPDPSSALDRALAAAGTRGTVVICGSIYLVGASRRELRSRFGTPTPP
ncbi:MAG TPA: Mur ligase family protein [Thermoanaerobaculia bacterium]|nr:Mur ligase family protein [Thermoanaerobaculia bacterium]